MCLSLSCEYRTGAEAIDSGVFGGSGGEWYGTGSTVTSSRDKAVPTIEIGSLAMRLLLKAAVLAAGWAGAVRVRGLAAVASMPAEEKDKEIIFLRDRVNGLQDQVKICRSSCAKDVGGHATLCENASPSFAIWSSSRSPTDR